MGTFLLVIVVLEVGVNGKSVTTEGESVVLGNKQNLAPIPIGLAVFLAHVVRGARTHTHTPYTSRLVTRR